QRLFRALRLVGNESPRGIGFFQSATNDELGHAREYGGGGGAVQYVLGMFAALEKSFLHAPESLSSHRKESSTSFQIVFSAF
ncbi:MAG: hypothetical protein WCY92_15215, partial [Novosphingobium sp.]